MAAQRTSFEKLQRDRAKKAKQAAKREKRQERAAGTTEETPDEGPSLIDLHGELSAADLLGLVEALHSRLEAGTISFDEFEEQKAELLGRVRVD